MSHPYSTTDDGARTTSRIRMSAAATAIGLLLILSVPSVPVAAEVNEYTWAPPFHLWTTESRTTPGLEGSYVDQSLRDYTPQDDWRFSWRG